MITPRVKMLPKGKETLNHVGVLIVSSPLPKMYFPLINLNVER